VGKKGKFSMQDHSHVAPYGYFLIENNTLSIGNDVAIGPFCSFFCSSNSHSPKKPLFRENYEQGDIHIGNNVFIGAQSVILPDTQIGDDVIIAANSVVKGKLESGFVYGGAPCKPIQKLSEDD
jgi:acetyltransferase-like isoleucine patch superfamily enzyme